MLFAYHQFFSYPTDPTLDLHDRRRSLNWGARCALPTLDFTGAQLSLAGLPTLRYAGARLHADRGGCNFWVVRTLEWIRRRRKKIPWNVTLASV